MKVGALAAQALAAEPDPSTERLSILLPRAVRFYLDQRDGGTSAWRYPSFIPEADVSREHEVPLDEDLWRELQAEADQQGVAPGELVQYAAYYYGAARDDGRLTERIAEELRREEEPGAPS